MTVDIWIRDYNPPRCFQKKISGRSKHNEIHTDMTTHWKALEEHVPIDSNTCIKVTTCMGRFVVRWTPVGQLKNNLVLGSGI
jgi:hypothetical protein